MAGGWAWSGRNRRRERLRRLTASKPPHPRRLAANTPFHNTPRQETTTSSRYKICIPGLTTPKVSVNRKSGDGGGVGHSSHDACQECGDANVTCCELQGMLAATASATAVTATATADTACGEAAAPVMKIGAGGAGARVYCGAGTAPPLTMSAGGSPVACGLPLPLPPVVVVMPVKGCRPHCMENWETQLGLQYGEPGGGST